MLKSSEIVKIIHRRIEEFKELGSNKFVIFDFSPFLDLKIKATIETELLFCISTANSSAISGLRFQKLIENTKLKNLSICDIEYLLKKSRVRFYKRKAKYIYNAIQNLDIITKVFDLKSSSARELLLSLKGIGMKEASHFLRNIGRDDIAIVDRHILRWLSDRGYISNIPKSISKRKYIEIENILKSVATQLNMTLAELDLYLWYQQTGKILK